VAQLEQVAEQDEPIAAGQRAQERFPRLAVPQHVGSPVRAEVEVREDQRPQLCRP
jgi:hypothetical protein